MDNFRDILSGDCFKLKNYTLDGIDKFGDMLHFQIRRKNMYTTKFGGCVTLLFLLLVGLTFGFYFRKFLNKRRPIIASDQYLGEDFLETDLTKERLNFFITPYDTSKKGGALEWDEFWDSYTLQAVNFSKGRGKKNKWNLSNLSWDEIGFKKCKGLPWVNNLRPTSLDRIQIEKSGICFDAKKLEIRGGTGFDESS